MFTVSWSFHAWQAHYMWKPLPFNSGHLLTILHFIFRSLSETVFQDAEPLGLVLYPSIFFFLSVISLHVPCTSGNFSQLYLAHLLLSFHLTFLLLRALYSVCLSLHSFIVSGCSIFSSLSEETVFPVSSPSKLPFSACFSHLLFLSEISWPLIFCLHLRRDSKSLLLRPFLPKVCSTDW